jgi:hypothetical protein
MDLVRERTIQTERQPLVGEVVPIFTVRRCRVVSTTDSHGRLFRSSRPESLLFLQVAPQLLSRGWMDPVPDPPLLRKSGSAGNRIRDLWICSQKLWPLDHRGGQGAVLAVKMYAGTAIRYNPGFRPVLQGRHSSSFTAEPGRGNSRRVGAIPRHPFGTVLHQQGTPLEWPRIKFRTSSNFNFLIRCLEKIAF